MSIVGVTSNSYVKHPLYDKYKKLKRSVENVDGIWNGNQLQTMFSQREGYW